MSVAQVEEVAETVETAEPVDVKTEDKHFTEVMCGYLFSLKKRAENGDPDARTALVNLKHILDQEAPPFQAVRRIEPFLPTDISEKDREIVYKICGLFAFHPMPTQFGNFGNSYRSLLWKKKSGSRGVSESMSTKFCCVLDQYDAQGVMNFLAGMVTMMKNEEVRVNYLQLMVDLMAWGQEKENVPRRWAMSCWSRYKR